MDDDLDNGLLKDDDFHGDEPTQETERTCSTIKQLDLFQQRYKNGYDLYTDADYVAWLVQQ